MAFITSMLFLTFCADCAVFPQPAHFQLSPLLFRRRLWTPQTTPPLLYDQIQTLFVPDYLLLAGADHFQPCRWSGDALRTLPVRAGFLVAFMGELHDGLTAGHHQIDF